MFSLSIFALWKIFSERTIPGINLGYRHSTAYSFTISRTTLRKHDHIYCFTFVIAQVTIIPSITSIVRTTMTESPTVSETATFQNGEGFSGTDPIRK